MSQKYFFTIVFFLLNTFLFAQNQAIDSMYNNASNEKNDSLKVKKLNDVVWELMFNDKNRAIKIANEALVIAEKTNNQNSLSDSYNTLGVYYMIISDYTTSIKFHEKALAIRLKLNDKKGLLKTYNNLGSSKKEIGNYKEEIDYYFKALKITEELKDSINEAKIEMNVADAFIRQLQFDQAEKYYLLALKILEAFQDVSGQTGCYIGLGVLNYKTLNYKQSEMYYQKAEKLIGLSSSNFLVAKFHANYAALLKDINKKDEAIKHIQQSIELNEKIGNTNSNLVNYINLASIYEDLKKTQLAKQTYTKALNIALEIGSKQWQKQSYLGVATTSYSLGDFKTAYDNYEKYSDIKDSLQGEEISKSINELSAKYETEKKENQIKSLEQEKTINELTIKEQQHNLQKRNYLLIASILLLLILSVGIYFWYGNQQLKNKLENEKAIKETEEHERLRIAKDIHDDLGSGLSKINFLSELIVNNKNQSSEIKENAISISETAKKLVDNMRDLIWALNPENTTLAGLVSRIREYTSDYMEDFSTELKFNFPENVSFSNISKESYREIFMSVKECLNNIVKHSQAKLVELETKIENNNLYIAIKDNGIGFSDVTQVNGNGLRNMKNRIESVGGTFELKSDAKLGTQILFVVPLQKILKS